MKKGFLDNFSKIAGKNLCRCLFLIKVAGLRPATLLKRDSDTGVFKNRFSTGAIQSLKSVQIRSFPGSVSFRISTGYQKMRTRKNSLFAHFLRSNCRKDFCRKQLDAVLCKKDVCKIFANFTRKFGILFY